MTITKYQTQAGAIMTDIHTTIRHAAAADGIEMLESAPADTGAQGTLDAVDAKS